MSADWLGCGGRNGTHMASVALWELQRSELQQQLFPESPILLNLGGFLEFYSGSLYNLSYIP